MANPLQKYLRKQVIVSASGITYQGTLVEVSDTEILLKTPTGWVSVQMDKVSGLRMVGESPPPLKNKFVDPSFFDPNLEEKSQP
jgi:hypothetical protein